MGRSRLHVLPAQGAVPRGTFRTLSRTLVQVDDLPRIESMRNQRAAACGGFGVPLLPALKAVNGAFSIIHSFPRVPGQRWP